MDDVERRTGDRGVGNHFLERGQRPAALEGRRRSQVDERRRLVLRGHLEHLQQLAVAHPRRIAQAEAEPDSPLAQAALHELPQPGELLVARGAVEGVVVALAERERPVRVAAGEGAPQCADARRLVAHRRAVIDERRTAAARIPALDGKRPDLELQRGRHPIHRLVAAAGRVLAVRVQIDETGGHHEARGVHGGAPLQRVFGDRHDRAVLDSDVAHRVESALRIDDPPAGDHQIMCLACGRDRLHQRRFAARAPRRRARDGKRQRADPFSPEAGRVRRASDRRPAAPSAPKRLAGSAFGPSPPLHDLASQHFAPLRSAAQTPGRVHRALSSHHHNPSTFHHAIPTASQMTRLTTDE